MSRLENQLLAFKLLPTYIDNESDPPSPDIYYSRLALGERLGGGNVPCITGVK